jgi:hypothetical protein|nr:MAG TPA: hypothetical protein [Caudoviricetes sp.]
MDTVEYTKTLRRLCKSQANCLECPLHENCEEDNYVYCNGNASEYVEKSVHIVEQWAKDNPIKTRQSEFLKKFPNAYLNTITRLLPCSLDKTLKPSRCAKYGYLSITCRCDRCRDDYWNEEVDE